jgi:hypothetical protein
MYKHPTTGKEYVFEKASLHTKETVVNKSLHTEVVHTTTITIEIPENAGFELFEGKIFKGEASTTDADPIFAFKGQIGQQVGGKMEWKPFEGKIPMNAKY